MFRQAEPGHYFKKSYDTKERFISYWYQIHNIVSLDPKRALEIGIGNSFVFKYLKDRKVNVVSLDIDIRLNPDVTGNILDIPFADKTFDVVACFEVLEHLAYDSFDKALSEIFRVSNSYAILSLPDSANAYRLHVQVPGLVEIKKLFPLPRLKAQIHKFDGQHYWEIGKAGYPFDKIVKNIQKIGFKIENTYRIFEHPYYRFFILKKSG